MRIRRLFTAFAVPMIAGALFSITAEAADKVAVIAAPQDGAAPEAKVDAAGVVHICYVAGGDVYYARSADNGATFSTPLRVNSRPGTAAPPLMHRGPDLAIGRGGTVHVIWYTNGWQQKLPKDQWGVYYARLPAGSSTFEPERNINHLPSDNYSIASNTNGQVAIFWTAQGLFNSRSDDDGKSFGTPEKVTVADPCQCCATRAFFGDDGTLFCAYRDENGGSLRDMYLLANPFGRNVWNKTKASGTPWQISACPMTGCSLGGDHGGMMMAWETKGVISFARFDSHGAMSGREIVVPGDGGKYPVVLTAPDGVTCLSWKKGSTLHWRQFDANGAPLGDEASKPSPNTARHAGFVAKTGDFVLVD